MLFLILLLMFNFFGLDAVYYWLNGAAVMEVIGLSKPETEPATA